MTRPRSDTSLASLLLAQRLVEGGADPLKASEYWAVVDTVGDPAALLGLDATVIASTTRLDPVLAERVARLLDAATSFAFALDEAHQAGVEVISALDEEYPAPLHHRLGRTAPPLLYLVGDAQLLRTDLIGIVGARDVAEPGAEAARRAAAEAVRHGHGVVSGGAKGVDRLAMFAALESGGIAVGVLADSLVRVTRDPEVRRSVADGRLCLCTPYNPTAGFSVANAMGRNKLIYALSKATLVVAADTERGGTWAGAVEALRRGVVPVLAWAGPGAGEGNAKLTSLGAAKLDSVADIFPLPALDQTAEPHQDSGQLALDV